MAMPVDNRRKIDEFIKRLVALDVRPEGAPEAEPKQGYLRCYIGKSYNRKGSHKFSGVDWYQGQDATALVNDLVRRINNEPESGTLWLEAVIKGDPNPADKCEPFFHEGSGVHDSAMTAPDAGLNPQGAMVHGMVTMADRLYDLTCRSMDRADEMSGSIVKGSFELGRLQGELEASTYDQGQLRLAQSLETVVPLAVQAIGVAMGNKAANVAAPDAAGKTQPGTDEPEARADWNVSALESLAADTGSLLSSNVELLTEERKAKLLGMIGQLEAIKPLLQPSAVGGAQ